RHAGLRKTPDDIFPEDFLVGPGPRSPGLGRRRFDLVPHEIGPGPFAGPEETLRVFDQLFHLPLLPLVRIQSMRGSCRRGTALFESCGGDTEAAEEFAQRLVRTGP